MCTSSSTLVLAKRPSANWITEDGGAIKACGVAGGADPGGIEPGGRTLDD